MSGTTDNAKSLMRTVIVGCMARVYAKLALIGLGFTEEQAKGIVKGLSPGALDRMEREVESRLDFSGISMKLGGDHES